MTRRDILILALASAAIAACGKKPDLLRPPQGADPSRYPRPYPNPKYDAPNPQGRTP